MKKILSLVLVAVLVFSLTACGSSKTSDSSKAGSSTTASEASGKGVALKDMKVGFIFIGDENEGYTAAHYEGAKEMAKELGLKEDQVIYKWTIPEGSECLDAAEDLAEQGCKIIFANSFGHEQYMIEAAKDYPEVQFCHATGYQAATVKLANFHNYFTDVYESRYVSGVVAGLKLNEMIKDGKIKKDEAKIGYVGAFPYAEVISGFTSFYLGVKSVCETATMEVQYTSSWADMTAEKQTAEKLIADKCVLISQHADTTGAPTACEAKGVPVVGYNVSMIATAPTTALTSASINWAPYYTFAVKSVIDGTAIPTDWCKGYADGADKITELNDKVVASGTADKVKEVETAIKDGKLHVFDTKTFTIGGKSLEDYLAGDKASKDEKKLASNVKDGYYNESGVQSAPSFAFIIDGITVK